MDSASSGVAARAGSSRTTKNHKGTCPEHSDVVRVDVHSVLSDLIGGERDRIGRHDETPIAGVDDGRVLANLWPDQ